MTKNGTRAPLTLVVLNSKGGVGKTATTMMLAAAFTEAGRTVEVWDADPQGSASEWIEDATEERGAPLPIRHEAVKRTILARGQSSAEVLLIDTPPGDPDTQTAAAARADLVIVPTEAAPADVPRVFATVDALGQAVPSVVLLNKVEPHTLTHADTLAVLEAEGVPYFATMIPRRQMFKRAFGTWPTTRQLGLWTELAAEIETRMTR